MSFTTFLATRFGSVSSSPTRNTVERESPATSLRSSPTDIRHDGASFWSADATSRSMRYGRRLHFAPIHERRGRSLQGLPLTVWFRDFGHPNLFSALPDQDDRPVAAVDANIVIDLADAVQTTTSKALTAEWLLNAVHLGVTDQVLLEIDKQQDTDRRTANRNFASWHFLQLQASHEIWVPLHEGIRNAVDNPERYDSDLKHVARAAAGGARWLITRDTEFQRACSEAVREVADLEVVTPGEFLLIADKLVRDDTYRPADFAGSSLEIRGLQGGEFDSLARVFLNQREGEKLSQMRERLETLASMAPKQSIRVLTDQTEYLGLLATSVGTITEIQLCRVHKKSGQSTIARQLLALAREEAAAHNSAAVRLVDPHCGEVVRRAATNEDYVPAGVGFTALPIPGVGSRSQLVALVEERMSKLPPNAVPPELPRLAATPTAVQLTEDRFHPWRLTETDLPGFVVSIEPVWAAELFDIELARGSLFPRGHGLALQREHVYYRSPAATGGVSAPGRILWYVKGGPAHQAGLRAVSTLREVTVGDPYHLYRRFAHLGVYSQDQVVDASDGSNVMALRFSHSTMLPKPIPLAEYRKVMQSSGVGVTLQGPQRLPERVFDELIACAYEAR